MRVGTQGLLYEMLGTKSQLEASYYSILFAVIIHDHSCYSIHFSDLQPRKVFFVNGYF